MIQLIYEDTEPLFEMAKLTKKYASKKFGDFGDILYFSQKNHSSGPRVKFGGGTRETNRTDKAPTLKISKDFKYTLSLQPWMNSDNCPNAFNADYVDKVKRFVTRSMAVILLTWFFKLDDADTLEYFKGNLTFKDLIKTITDISENDYNNIQKLKNDRELYDYCIEHDLFNFE